MTPTVPMRPEDVPGAVDADLLRATLGFGRPVTLGQRPGVALDPGAAPDDIVLCVHGLGHDAWDFAPLQQLAQPGIAVVPFDLPGFGPTRLDDAEPAPVDLDDLAAAIAAAATALPRPPVLVASSLGGHAALIAALAHPGAFAGLVLLSPGGLVEVPQALQSVLRSYYSVQSILSRPDDEIVRNSRRIFVRPHPLGEQLAARKLALHRSPREIKARFAVPFASVCDDVFKRPVLADVSRLAGLPMSVIFGDGDVVVPLSSGRQLEDRCGAKLHILERSGHCPHLEDPARVADIVFAFARSVFADAQKGGF